ncbi:bifunctional ornithine acetyltransferase/N-acetylglutamate synthase [Kurthia sibirica]|uniref:Arginine biosynthesis bifunctional protein ArgJ n=1 Tax=Kurthia sibirica TaxID=202750 RepID=A0A2U3AJ35_9BACL|nr:bifunctional ornithine acetyltransferase/N-acetylglutamate synthase [Kurthia sibirica]PWI24517.1 N-acetylglutamate synthase [Kurthia sibirica]GEK33586.1 arginine biosynthesis bifunctional protein ArgJ [Kurthia sibirica]
MTQLIESAKRLVSESIIAPKGFSAAGFHCGLKHKKKDIGMIFSEVPASVAGVFTTNAIKAAPLVLTKNTVYANEKMQAIIINSGNANACTGEQGIKDAKQMQVLAAAKLGIDENLVGVASTGVIGERMKMDKVEAGIAALQLGGKLENAIDFAQSILTTDTVMKNTAYSLEIDGKEVIIAGVAKGSGMIEPNMATMLGFITTDANIEQSTLQSLLKETTDITFNAITVDGDTSTNDTVLVLANGLANNQTLDEQHPQWSTFVEIFQLVSRDLAKLIAKDGEGATKLIEVTVEGGATDAEALKIAKTVVGSPLVKTAVFGCDANWGRVICAIGYSGCSIDPTNIQISIGQTMVVDKGEPLQFDEAVLTAYLKNHEVKIYANLFQGDGYGQAWGCDLTYDYVQINATYRS